MVILEQGEKLWFSVSYGTSIPLLTMVIITPRIDLKWYEQCTHLKIQYISAIDWDQPTHLSIISES